MRMFSQLIKKSLLPHQPPVLLLGEAHSRPSAWHSIHRSLLSLKAKGYGTFMCEGIDDGHTLEENFNHEKIKEEITQEAADKSPSINYLVSQRYQLSTELFLNRCSPALDKISLYKINFSSNPSLNMHYNPNIAPLYQALITRGFTYYNLDKDFFASPERPLASCENMNFRDEQYAKKISAAYREGSGIICMLGGAYMLSQPNKNKRPLMGNRLDTLGIPYIGLFLFSSEHTPVCNTEAAWRKQTFPAQHNKLNPSRIYSLDVGGHHGVRYFLDAVNKLTDARRVKAGEEIRNLVSLRPSR